MSADLPPGLTTRSLTMDDAPAVFEAMAAQETHDIGQAEVELADIVGEWQRPSFDVASSTVGVFDGELMVGYAEVGPSERGDAVVRPPYRGRGIGTWLARWMRDTARARGASIVGMPVPEGSDGDRLLTALGYHVRWTSWVLKLPPGATIVERPLPAGYAVRTAEPAEYRDAHTVVEDAFLEWSVRERESFEDFAAVTVERPGFEPWHLRVVTDETGTIVGVAVLSVYEGDDDGSEAFIPRLAVRRDLRGRGLAQALMVDAFARAREHGTTTAGLSTDSRTGALGLYEKVGMQVTSTWLHRAVRLLPPGYASRALTMADAEAVHAVVAAEEVADLGRVTVDLDDIVGEWQRPDADLDATTVGVERDGVLVAYGELTDDHAFAAVHPDRQGQGIGRWVAQWLEDRARSLGWAELGGQVFQGGPADRLLVARGYAERWTAWDLELPDGVDIPTVGLPEGYRLRVAEAGDHEACWTVFEDAFLEWSDRERKPLADFGSLMWERPGFEPWNLRVVTDGGGAIVGAVFVTPTDGGDAYVHKVAVRADQRGRGLARVLLADAFAESRSHGAARALLSTDTRAGARGLYESVGMVVESTWVNRVLALA